MSLKYYICFSLGNLENNSVCPNNHLLKKKNPHELGNTLTVQVCPTVWLRPLSPSRSVSLFSPFHQRWLSVKKQTKRLIIKVFTQTGNNRTEDYSAGTDPDRNNIFSTDRAPKKCSLQRGQNKRDLSTCWRAFESGRHNHHTILTFSYKASMVSKSTTELSTVRTAGTIRVFITNSQTLL